MKPRNTNVFLSLLFAATTVFSQDITDKSETSAERQKPYWFVPSYLNMQYAGNTGFLSACAGYKLYKDKLFFDFGYGYTPSSKSGTDIHNLIARINYRPWRKNFALSDYNFSFNPFTVGLAVTRQIKSDYTWDKLPNYYPEGYYHQNAVRLHLNLGLNLNCNFNKTKFDIYWQVTSNDVYFSYIAYYCHDNWIHWHKIFSQTIGINFYLF